MVEKKCVEIVVQQTQVPTALSRDQWQALIALHRTLLNEHHDFFSVSHHSAAPLELRELASKYEIPARMWRHRLRPLLELMQRQCNEDSAYMNTTLHTIFSMLNRLKIEVPEMADDWADIALDLHRYVGMIRRLGTELPETDAEISSRKIYLGGDFQERWREILRNIDRYRMAIDEADLRDQQVWSATAQIWYHHEIDLQTYTKLMQLDIARLARSEDVQPTLVHDCSSKSLAVDCAFFEDLSAPLPRESDRYRDSCRRLYSKDALWALMAGWYQIGGRISTNFRSFYKVFTFFPWATASLI